MSSALEVSLKIHKAKFKIDALVARTVESIGDGSQLRSVKHIQTVLSHFRRTEYAVMAAFPATMEEARKIGVTLRYTATQGSASMDPEDAENDTMPERESPVQELIRSLEVGYNRLSSIYASLTEASTQLPAIVQEPEEGGASTFPLAQDFLDAIERLRTLDLAVRQEGGGQDGDTLMTSPPSSPSASHSRRCTPLRRRTTSAADQSTLKEENEVAESSRGHNITLDLAGQQEWREQDGDIMMTSPFMSPSHSRCGTPLRRRTTSAAYQNTFKEDSEVTESGRGHNTTLDLAEQQERREHATDILKTSPPFSAAHSKRGTPLRRRTISAAYQRTFKDSSVMADTIRGHDITLELAEQQWREHDTDILMTSRPLSTAQSRRGTPLRRRTTSAAYQSTLKENSEEAETTRGHSEPQQSANGLRRSARARHQPPNFSVGETSHRTRRQIQLDAELRSLRGDPGWNL